MKTALYCTTTWLVSTVVFWGAAGDVCRDSKGVAEYILFTAIAMLFAGAFASDN